MQELDIHRPQLTQAQTRPAGAGWEWLVQAWRLFKNQPFLWIVLFVAYMVLMMILGMIPLVNLLTLILGTIFVGGLMLGADAQDQGDGLKFEHLFAGFQKNTGQLALLGLLYLVTLLIAMIPGGVIMGGSMVAMLAKGGSGAAEAMTAGGAMTFAVGALVMLACMVPVMMAYWLAPPLVAINGLSAFDAMKISFFACLKNFLPFFVLGIVAFFISILAMIPFGLGLLIAVPVFMLSAYTAYKDIFEQ